MAGFGTAHTLAVHGRSSSTRGPAISTVPPSFSATAPQFSHSDLGGNGNLSPVSTGAGETTPVTKEGYLKKKNPKGFMALRTWKNRWFHLTDQALSYYEKPGDAEPLKILPVPNIKRAIKVPGKPPNIEITTNLFMADGKARVFILQATGDEEADDWVTAINRNADVSRKLELKVGTADTSRMPSSAERQDRTKSIGSLSSQSSFGVGGQESCLHVSRTLSPPKGQSAQPSRAPSNGTFNTAFGNTFSTLNSAFSTRRGSNKTNATCPDEPSSPRNQDSQHSMLADHRSTSFGSKGSRIYGHSQRSTQSAKSFLSGAIFMKKLVSKNKKRFEQDGFSLDLAYITDRIIAMGFPSIGVEGSYRNHVGEVYRFFETRHMNRYKVYNLCSERTYDSTVFEGRVESYPFDDHCPPPFEMMRPMCLSLDAWLREHQDNVVAIHCKAGKGRTGCMIVAYLLHMGMFATADEALGFYGKQRTWDGKGVTIRSQQRYCHYFAQNLGLSRPLRYLSVTQIRILDPPAGGPYTVKIRNGSTAVSSEGEVTELEGGGSVVELHIGGLRVAGDVLIQVVRRRSGQSSFMKKSEAEEKVCHVFFNTCFHPESVIRFRKSTLDGSPKKDKKDEKFLASFALEMQVEPGVASHPRAHHPLAGVHEEGPERHVDYSGMVEAESVSSITKSVSEVLGLKNKRHASSARQRRSSSHRDRDSDAAAGGGQRRGSHLLSSISDETQSRGQDESEDSAELTDEEDDDDEEVECVGEAVMLHDFEPASLSQNASALDDEDSLDYLRLTVNDVVTIVEKGDSGWWLGLFKGEVGWFPSNYCAEISAPLGEDGRLLGPALLEGGGGGGSTLSSPKNASGSRKRLGSRGRIGEEEDGEGLLGAGALGSR